VVEVEDQELVDLQELVEHQVLVVYMVVAGHQELMEVQVLVEHQVLVELEVLDYQQKVDLFMGLQGGHIALVLIHIYMMLCIHNLLVQMII